MDDAGLNLDGVEDAFAMNASQLGMLYHSEAEPGTGVYVGVLDCVLPNDVDIARFKAAWMRVMARHDALRSVFVWQGLDEPLQVVRSVADIKWEEPDAALPGKDGALDRAYVEAIRQEGLSLTDAPTMRFILGRLPSGTLCFLWVCHHALIDDWSQALVMKEVQTVYHSGDADLPDAVPYGVFADWLAERDPETDETHWRREFAGYAGPARLQLQRTTGTPDVLRSETMRYLDVAASEALRNAATQNRVTLAAVATGVWSIVLHRLTGARDVGFAIATTQRPPELGDMDRAIGNFVTTMPTRLDLDTYASLLDVIRASQTKMLDGQPHSGIALSRLQQILGVPTKTPLFDSILSFKQDALSDLLSDDTNLFAQPTIQFKSNFPLAMVVMPGHQIGLRVIHDPRVYTTTQIDVVLNLFEAALRAAPNTMTAPPMELPVMSPHEETAHVLTSDIALGNAEILPQRIYSQAMETPDAPALISTDQTLTYSDLLTRAQHLAGALRAKGLNTGDRVGLYLNRSVDVPVAMLGTMLAGMTYVPFDAAFPQARLDKMINTARVSAIVADRDDFARLTGKTDTLLDIHDLPTAHDTGRPEIPGDALAYIMFTSGSTGMPKGVMVNHDNLAASTHARSLWYEADPTRYLLLSSHAFDSSVPGIFWTLATGGSVIIPDAQEAQDIATLGRLIKENQVTHTLCLPSVYDLLLDSQAENLTTLDTVIVAGEETMPPLVSKHHTIRPRTKLVNEYGPTEATVWCTAAVLEPTGIVPIGRPIPGTVLRITDPEGRIVPDGLPGELHVGGAGVAQGYFDLPDDTQASFSIDREGQRFYRTGDLVRRNADGQLTYLGRADSQIKLRGYRIEPSEIEAILSSRPDIRESALHVVGQGASVRLIAYIVPNESAHLSPEQLTTFCKHSLPEYMVPAQFVPLTDLPRTPNGKIDRAALPEPHSNARDEKIVEPGTQVESVLAEIWRQLLWVDRKIGITEDFHDLGGHSLLAMRLVVDIEQTFDIVVPMSEIGRVTTIAQQAQMIETLRRDHSAPAPEPQAGIVPSIFAGLDGEELGKLKALTSSWKSPAAREGGKIRVLNADGTRPPLFFCSLGEFSFTQLAEHLGKDQPIYGLRGSNGVVPITHEDAFEENMRRTAITYLPELLDLIGDGPILLGGYCQGATIALNLASLLTSLQHDVATVIMMEKTPPIRYPGHVDILFARNSFLNPYLQFEKPDALWTRRYGSHSFGFVDGDYGTAFQMPNMLDLAGALRKRLEAAAARAPTWLPRTGQSVTWDSADLPAQVSGGQPYVLNVTLRNTSAHDWAGTELSGLRLRATWCASDGTALELAPTHADLPRPVPEGQSVTVALPIVTPEDIGAALLEVDLIEEGVARFSKMGSPALTLMTQITQADARPISTPEPVQRGDQDLVTQARALSEAARTTRSTAGLSRNATWQGTLSDVETETAIVLGELSQLHLQDQHPQDATRMMTAALALDPSNTRIALDLARLQIEQRAPLTALRTLLRARRMARDRSEVDATLSAYFSPRAIARAFLNHWRT